MSRRCAFVVATLCAVGLNVHAEMLDRRVPVAPAEVDASYKSVPVEDLVSGMVPPAMTVLYEHPRMRSARVSLSGRGLWPVLLNRALSGAGLVGVVDYKAKTILILGARLSAPIAKVVPFGAANGTEQLYSSGLVTADSSPAALGTDQLSAPGEVTITPSIQAVAVAPLSNVVPHTRDSTEFRPAKSTLVAADPGGSSLEAARETLDPFVPNASARPLSANGPAMEWPVVKGRTLKETIGSWAQRANWDLNFDERAVPNDRLMGGHVFNGSLADAVKGLVAAIRLDRKYKVSLNEGNHIIYVYAD